MKKLVSIALTLTFILGLFTVNTFAYTRPETDIVPLLTFDNESDLKDWSVNSSALTDCFISEDVDAQKGKYLVTRYRGNNNQSVKLTFPAPLKNNNGDCVVMEFDVRIPDTYDSSTDRFFSFHLRDYGGTTNQPIKINLKNKNPQLLGYSAGYFGNCFGTGWAHVKIEIDMVSDRVRTTIAGSKNITGYSVKELATGRNQYLYLCLQDAGGNATTPSTLHLDNFRIYKLENSDAYGAGENFLNEEMNYDETTAANNWGVWAPNSDKFVFVVAEGSETRNISCITEDGDTNKFMRMDSGDIATRTYFRRSVSRTKMFDIANIALAANATKPSSAILYQTKFRIDDVTKANTTSLTTVPYTSDGSDKAAEKYIFSINPKDGIVTVGEGSDKKIYTGLNILSKQWYTLNVFHNAESGYMRAEIIDNSGSVQVFEGVEADSAVNYGDIALVGFNNSSEEHTVVDFDALKVYSASASDAETFYTLSDFTADKADGTVTANITVSSDMVDVTSGAAKVIIASYIDNELQKLKISDVVPTTGTKTYTLEGVTDAETVKVMLWDAATNTLMPLYAPIIK